MPLNHRNLGVLLLKFISGSRITSISNPPLSRSLSISIRGFNDLPIAA